MGEEGGGKERRETKGDEARGEKRREEKKRKEGGVYTRVLENVATLAGDQGGEGLGVEPRECEPEAAVHTAFQLLVVSCVRVRA